MFDPELVRLLWFSAGIILWFMSLVYLFAHLRCDYSVIDSVWGLGFIVVVCLSYLFQGSTSFVHLMVWSMIVLWGLRLSVHITSRKRGKGEDERYAVCRRSWGPHAAWRSYFQIFLLQGVMMWLISLPVVILASLRQPEMNWWSFMGVVVWTIGWVYESVADFQLLRFRNDPRNKGKILTAGLWRYSRHPNYFGETLVWWGIFLTTLGMLPASWWGVVSPITITFLLLRVSGVTLLEKKYRAHPGYKAYTQQTSAFLPWWPRE